MDDFICTIDPAFNTDKFRYWISDETGVVTQGSFIVGTPITTIMPCLSSAMSGYGATTILTDAYQYDVIKTAADDYGLTVRQSR